MKRFVNVRYGSGAGTGAAAPIEFTIIIAKLDGNLLTIRVNPMMNMYTIKNRIETWSGIASGGQKLVKQTGEVIRNGTVQSNEIGENDILHVVADISLLLLPAARFSHGSVSDDHYIYVLGGYRRNAANNFMLSPRVERYDIERDEWETMAPMPHAMENPKCTVVGGVLYIVGLVGKTRPVITCSKYTIEENRWKDCPITDTILVAGVDHAGICKLRNDVIVSTNEGLTRYNTENKRWRKHCYVYGNFLGSKGDEACVEVQRHGQNALRLYSFDDRTSRMRWFDPEGLVGYVHNASMYLEDQTETPPRRAPSNYSFVADDRRILIVGGCRSEVIDGEENDVPINTIRVFDIATNRWLEENPIQLPEARSHCSCVLKDDILYVSGGLLEGLIATDTCRKYSFVRNEWI